MTEIPDIARSQGRLVIREIILQDFKSYGGRRVIGPFHECFSAIIGPNGSGKSNVIDALMFVFGKKAKKIRLSKLSELIHNPQKGSQRPPFARVEVIFHEIRDLGPNVYESVEGSELIVAREVASNNASKYIVNEKTSNWTEVTQLFSSKGIDLEHNRFLILQGEVEQIAMMKPMGDGQHEEGLLEYLEDLIGSNQFIEGIKEKTREFNELSDVRNEHIHRVKQAEKEKDALEGPRLEAEMYVKAATELLEEKCILAMIQRHQMDRKVEEARNDVNEAALELDKVAGEIEVETSKAKEIETDFDIRRRERDEAKNLMDKASAEFNELDKLDAATNAKKRLTKTSIEKELKEIETETKLIEKLQIDLEEMSISIIPKIESEVMSIESQFDKENDKLEQLFEAVHTATCHLKAKKEELEIESGRIQAEVDKVVSEQRLVQAERDVLVQKERTGEELRARSEKGVRRLEEQLAERKNELTEARETDDLFRSKLEEIKNKLNDISRDYEITLNQSTSAKQKLEQARSNYEQLTNGAGDGRMGGLANLHNRIMKESDKGKLKGVHGRLGDLGTCDSKYDVAFSVALSAQAEAVVVDTTADAQAVVAFVKANNLGRVTCIILEKAINETDSGLNSGLPRMVDLISVKKSELKNAFWYAMRDTLVAETIDMASKIGLGGARRYRVVTLAGQVIDPSGAMTGGGNAAALVTKGKNSRQAVEQAEKEISVMQAEYEKISTKFENIRNAKSALLSEKDSVERSLEQFAEIIGNQEEIEQLEEQRDAERKRVSSILIPKLTEEEVKQVHSLTGKIDSITQALKPKEAELSKVVNQIEQITQEIVSKAGEKTKRQKDIVDDLTANLDAKKKELCRLRVDQNKIDSKIQKSTKNIQGSQDELQSLREKYSAEEKELAEIEAKAEQVMQEFTEYRALVDRKGLELVELEKQFNVFKTKIVEMKKKHQEVLNEISKLEDVKKDFEYKSREFSKHINSIRKEYRALPHELVELNDEEREERARMQALAAVNAAPETQAMDTSGESAKALDRDLTGEELSKLSPPEVQTNLIRLEARMTKLHPNLKAIEDYRVKLREYKSKVKEMEQVCARREDVRKALEFLRQERLSMFMSGFNTITLKVKEMYQMLTLGGDAELELVDTTDPFAKGISFSVRPPKKTWKAITQLSGGEKTLSSLSLVFALHYFKPTPLYFLDEIDAALDTRNVAIISNYIKQRATNAQFIIISLRNQMFELADWLVGIYKTEHASKSVTLDPAAASAGLGAFKPQDARPFYASPHKSPQVRA